MPYLLRRFLLMLVVLWAIASTIFLLFRLMPGDPTAAYIEPTFTPAERLALLHQFGLDRPLWQQYFIFLGNLLHGDFGTSFSYGTSVAALIFGALPNTLVLAFAALVLAYIFGVLAGAGLAWTRGTWIEALAIPVVLATRALPDFWVGMVMLAIFAFGLGWLPGGGAAAAGVFYPDLWARFTSLDFARHLVLPVVTLAVILQGLPLLLMRSNMLEVMHEEFVVMARMKGLSEWSIMLRHAARNALLPLVTSFALGIGAVIGSSVVIETVFSWPGLGRMLVKAVASSDYPLAQGAFLLIATALVVMNFAADLLYGLLDPRVTHAT